MCSERLGILIMTAIVALLLGATMAVYSLEDASTRATSFAPDGRTVFLTKGCTGCHSREGDSVTAQIGPDLTDLAQRAGDRVEGLDADGYVRQSVLDPQAFIVDGYGPVMPALPLNTEELDALVDYLLSEA